MVQFCNIQTHLFHYVSEIGYLCLALQRKYRRVISVVGVPYAFGSARYRGFSFSYQMKGIIYIATNLFNGRSYIGQTRGTLDNRIRQHYQDAKKSESVNTFHYALAQYGRSGFEWKVLDEFEGTKEEVIHALNVAEEYHILKRKTMVDDYGYNSTKGGYSSDVFSQSIKARMKNSSIYRPVLQYSLDGIFIREFESISEVGRHFGKHVNIGSLIGLKWNGYQWRDKTSEEFPKDIGPYKDVCTNKCLLVYNSDGVFYKEFESEVSCIRDLGKRYKVRDNFADTTIKSKDIDRYLVFRKKSNSFPRYIRVRIFNKEEGHKKDSPVLQYTKKGHFVREYPSIASAHRATGVSQAAIRKWCQSDPPFRVQHSKTRWIWRYKGQNIEERIDPKGRSVVVALNHAVAQYSKEGNFIKVWKNVGQASSATGESAYLIKRQCLGLPTTKETPSTWRYYRDCSVAI